MVVRLEYSTFLRNYSLKTENQDLYKKNLKYRHSMDSKESIYDLSSEEFSRFVYSESIKLGEGSGGIVYLGENTETKEKVAIKVISLSSKNDKTVNQIFGGCKIMKEAKHVNILEIIGIHGNHSILNIVHPLMDGDLHTYIEYMAFDNIDKLYNIFNQMLSAVQYLHSKSVAHRDIKLQNFLVDDITKSPENIRIKLADFDYASLQMGDNPSLQGEEGSGYLFTDHLGSLEYIPPEQINEEPYDGKKSDIWSLGICFYTFIKREYPFYDPDQGVILLLILCNKPDLTELGNMKKVISSMLQSDPKNRPNSSDIII